MNDKPHSTIIYRRGGCWLRQCDQIQEAAKYLRKPVFRIAFQGIYTCNMKKLLIITILIAASWQLMTIEYEVVLGPGIQAPEPPVQTTPFSPQEHKSGEYTITPLAEFHIRAKVLAKKKYYFGREADLSPFDLVLGWGKMSDEEVLKQINISQSNRFYLWSVDQFPISRTEIETQSANMHLIPANDEINLLMKQVRKGEIIEIYGSLVRVDTKEGWRWISSMKRNDTGSGACEVVWVEELKIMELLEVANDKKQTDL